MKNIESIILHCENCESIEIEGRHIGEIFIDGMKEVIRRRGNKITKYRICEDFVLEIHRDANKRYKTFGMISDDVLFDRIINARDIVSITIKYDVSKTSEATLKAAIEKLGYKILEGEEHHHHHHN